MDWEEYNSGSNRASNFKIRQVQSARLIWNYQYDYFQYYTARGPITKLIISITNFSIKNVFWELLLSEMNICNTFHEFGKLQKQCEESHWSGCHWLANQVGIQLQSLNWIPIIRHPHDCVLTENNTISSPGFLSQQFNNLQWAGLLTSFWHHQFNNLQRAALLTPLVQYNKAGYGELCVWF